MNLSASALLSAAVIALLAACSSTSVGPEAGARAAPRRLAAGPDIGPEGSLQKGMTAGTVRQIMGAPDQIAPLESPSGHAEVWIYRRTTPGGTRQIQIGTRSIPIQTMKQPDGSERVVQSIDEPIFRQENESFEETVRLLIYDGVYLEQTRSVQRRMSYQ